MGRIYLLDCTLRDGGYINKWKFGNHTIHSVIDAVSKSKIDMIELGFLKRDGISSDYTLYSSFESLKEFNDSGSQIVRAVMLAVGDFDIDNIPEKRSTSIDMIRISFHKTRYETKLAISLAQQLAKKGYLVSFQPISVSAYNKTEFEEILTIASKLDLYSFYIVDTLGNVNPELLLELITIANQRLPKHFKIGFHSHNNLQLSLTNSLLLCNSELDRDFIIDCSIMGMGRGAGNLNTELIAPLIKNSNYKMSYILDVIDDCIYPFYLENQWGYSPFYYISAINECHPNYVEFIIRNYNYTLSLTQKVLAMIPKDRRFIFSEPIISEICRSITDEGEISNG